MRTHMAITVSSDTLTSGRIFSNLQSVDEAEMTMVKSCRQWLRMFFSMEGRYKSNKDFQASQLPAQSLAQLKQKMAVEDLGNM